MGKWRVYREIHKRFDHRIESFEYEAREDAIQKLVEISKECEDWREFSIQKFQDGEWASAIGAWIEAEDIIENGKDEIECDFDPPCQSCQERAAKKSL